MKKLIVCIKSEFDRHPMGGTGIHGHETKIVPHNKWKEGDYIIEDGDALDLIMERLSRYQFRVYGGTAIYLDVAAIRKRMNRAFYKEAVHTYGMHKSDAKTWSRAMADAYFTRDGFPLRGMIEEIKVDYENDFSQATFDAYVIEEISCW